MRDLITATAAVLLLIAAWLIFFSYSEENLKEYTADIEEVILPFVEQENWEDACKQIEQLNLDWHQYKKTALFFLDTETINEIDYCLAKSIKYIKAKDVSNSSGELNSMIEQFTFLSSNDKVNLSNIF